MKLPVMCPYCVKLAELADSEEIYGRSYGNLWICRQCGSYVGCHKGTDNPLGTICDEETREWRKQLHKVFDPIWENGEMSRKQTYAWLAVEMGIDVKQCHISMFTAGQCGQATAICEQR